MPALSRLADNIFLLSTGILALCAWVIAFGGACAARGLSGGGWWLIVYELLLIVGTLLVFIFETFSHYRMALLAFLAISIALMTPQIDFAVTVSEDTSDFTSQLASALVGISSRGGLRAYAAGYTILIIIQFLWVFAFGSEPNSYVDNWTNIHNSVEQHPRQTQSQPQQQQYEMTGDKTFVSPPTTPHPATSSSVVEYKERVEALHDYTASADDPNELSFKKGEVLEVVERKGNWWQARKSDGTVGIIPSNYFAPPS